MTVDVWQAISIVALSLVQLHHSWCHLQDAKGRQKVMEARHVEERMLYDALDAFFRGKGTYPERDAKVRRALATYEATHLDGTIAKNDS